jgi:spore maturation protein CgeB
VKLFIIGSSEIYALENIYKKYLQQLGTEVTIFAAQSYFYAYYKRSVLNKVLYRLNLSTILPSINKRVKDDIEAFRPDVVWVFKGMEIYPATLDWIKRRGITLVNYNPDNPVIFSSRGSGNRNVTMSIPLYDLHFTYNRETEQVLQEKFHLPTAYLPFGYDISDDLFKQCMLQEEVVKCCFLGNPDNERAAFLEQLASEIEIDVYGHDWNRFVTHPNIHVLPPVYNDDFWKVLYKYRVQLNIMRPHNRRSHNMRSFEIPGVGGIQVAADTPEHRAFFKPGKEIMLYKDVNDCIHQCRQLLSMASGRAAEIRKQARQRSIQSGYNYYYRTKSALQVMEELLHGKFKQSKQ